MAKATQKPDYIFESSWEVCNKVGGIYTVLSTRAKTLQEAMDDKLVFIGPDFGAEHENPLFTPEDQLFADWVEVASSEGLKVRTGRWNIPGHPIVVLVDFTPFYAVKNDIYGALWTDFQVDSLHGYGDYDEASMFSYAAGRVVESFYNYYMGEEQNQRVVYHANEWMLGLGALYVRKHVPTIATLFTTHATSIGRSIAGNNKPLYDYLYAYNGNQMAQELNVESKHSIERQTAMYVDCFTTVSDITAAECAQLLDTPCHVVLKNGFEDDFVPSGAAFTAARKRARQRLLSVAGALTGTAYADDTLILATSGRYEFKNKGIDVFLEAMKRLAEQTSDNDRRVLAFVEVPAWVAGPRADLLERLSLNKVSFDTALPNPVITHELHNQGSDSVLGTLSWFGMHNAPESRVHVIFVPCYLDGRDGIFNTEYYEQLIGVDLTVYPSYYEPWGYTPLESVAFKIPTITTSLSGFGAWANTLKGAQSHITDGVEVINRTDYNYTEVADAIVATIRQFATFNKKQTDAARKAAATLAQKALWKNFIADYWEAYDIAIKAAEERNK